jgi:hypothetical protein
MNDRTVSGLSLLTTGIFVIGYMLGRHGAESQRASAVALAAAKSGASDADGAEEASTGNPSADGTTTARVRFAESLASTEQAPTPERTSVWVSDGGGGGEDGQEETELEDKGKQRAAEVDGNDSDATATGASPTLRPRSLRLRIPGSDVVTTGDSSRS